MQSGFFTDWYEEIDIEDDDTNKLDNISYNIPILTYFELKQDQCFIQLGGGIYNRLLKIKLHENNNTNTTDYNYSDFGLFFGIGYSITITKRIAIPIISQVHYVFIENDKMLVFKIGIGISINL